MRQQSMACISVALAPTRAVDYKACPDETRQKKF
jgi:hypothetical protein